jgi:hypothetical protein
MGAPHPSGNTMNRTRSALAALAVLISSGFASAQVKERPRAEKLDVQIRYRIRADRDERIRQFQALEKHLLGLGFEDARKNDPERELDIVDPNAERFVGTISSKNVLRLLDDSRVLSILFAPAGYAYPDSSDKPVPVRIVIRGGLLPAHQQVFHGQTLARLELLGFREALGYDTREYTQIKGTIPYKYLPKLVKDLRLEPSGWFLSDTPPDRLPQPYADANPLRWVEVMPAAELPAPFAPLPVLPARAKLSPELRDILLDPAAKETSLRVAVLFAVPIENRIEELRTRLSAHYGPSVKRNAAGAVTKGPDGQAALTDGAALEGAIGNLGSIRFDRPGDIERFAEDAQVLTIRLSRGASETITPMPEGTKAAPAADLLKSSGVDALHRLGYTGRGVKVVLIGSDFTGAERLIGNGLPKNTRVIDMTSELNDEVVPTLADANRVGNGLAAARAFAAAAPDAELILVRIDPGAIFQLFTILNVANGDETYSEAMRSRLSDITLKTADLTRRKEAAINEYREAFQDLSDDEPAKARRARAKAALDAVTAEQELLVKRIDRLNTFRRELLALLKGTRVVVNTLEWESSFPLDALSELSQRLERMSVPLPPRVLRRPGDPKAAPRPPLVWVQAGSNAGTAVWGGAFLDANRNGTMEFSARSQPIPPGSWTPEMNFLGFQSGTGETVADLPSGARMRLTMQWREPLDPNFPMVDRPVYPLVLRVFRQLDPEGEKRPSDEMAEEARSVGGPYPILTTSSSVVFEQILEFTAQKAGRYAVVVGIGIQPEPLLPALKREAEIQPRIVVETLTGKPADGRVVFRSYVNPSAGVGIPGDSIGVVTVGSGAPGELIGGGTGLTLRPKPDLFAPGSLDTTAGLRGTGIATGFVGGIATALVQTGASGANPFASSGFAPGKSAVVPEAWIKYLRPAARP